MSDTEKADKVHVLLVEDESGILASLQMILEMEGYRVTTASDGRQALLRLADAPPDVVVTDYMMPYMAGGELLRRIRSDARLNMLPVVLMSALPPRRGHEHEQLADAVLAKPFSVDQLLELLSDLLSRPRD